MGDISFLIVTTTTETKNHAQEMARHLVMKKLVACAEIHEIQSTYVWKDELCETSEFLLVMKTRADLYQKIETEIKSMHTYELPQIIALPITQGLPAYLHWIEEQTRV